MDEFELGEILFLSRCDFKKPSQDLQLTIRIQIVDQSFQLLGKAT